MHFNILLTAVFLFIFIAYGCSREDEKAEKTSLNEDDTPFTPKKYVEINHPEWSRNAVIYEVNIRQYTPEGTFKAFEKHLPRLKEMGIDILWIMPVHPIGEKNRKGTKGSYYAVKDYYAVNPEFGTMDDFRSLVKKIHDTGMYVIIDWVANHSAWDNKLTETNPEWYTRTVNGEFQPTPWYDWDDIIDFDYNQPGIRKYMTDVLKYWVKEADIDGYRCDIAGFIPIEFWENVRVELDNIKPVFMLAEWESRDLHKKSFDMTYSWSFWDKLKAACNKKGANALVEYLAHHVNTFPEDGYRMLFTDNHDKNSWEGNQYSNFGKGLEVSMAATVVVSGMPLVYSGQEAGLDRSLAFFEKDLIEWKEHKNAQIYKKLFELKHKNLALRNGDAGGEMIKINNNSPQEILTFAREKDGDRVLPVLNFSDKSIKVKLEPRYFSGEYDELFSGKKTRIDSLTEISIPAWGYLIFHSTGKEGK